MLPRRVTRRDRKPSPGSLPVPRNEAAPVHARRGTLVEAEQPRPGRGPDPTTLAAPRPAAAPRATASAARAGDFRPSSAGPGRPAAFGTTDAFARRANRVGARTTRPRGTETN